MNKKIFLLVLFALAAGALTGYAGKLLIFFPLPIAEKTEQVEPPPHFVESSATALQQESSSRMGKSEILKLDDRLKQYVRMDTEKLWTELETLEKQTEINCYLDYYDITQNILTFYIHTRLGQDAPRQTLSKIKDNPALDRHKQEIIDAWKRKNPESVMAYCQENMNGEEETDQFLQGEYISLLSKSAPEKAIDYLLTLSPEDCAKNISLPLLEIVMKNPEKMTKIMETLKSVKWDKWYDFEIFTEWAKTDKDAAEQWIRTLPGENRSYVMRRVAAALPRKEALEKINSLSGEEKWEALKGLSYESQTEQLDLARKYATEEQVSQLSERAYWNFNSHDTELISYIDKMPEGIAKESLLENVIRNNLPTIDSEQFLDPKLEDSLALINKMSSPEKKEEILDDILNNWKYHDPEKVKSWVQQSSLPSNKKKDFIEQCDNILQSREDEA